MSTHPGLLQSQGLSQFPCKGQCYWRDYSIDCPLPSPLHVRSIYTPFTHFAPLPLYPFPPAGFSPVDTFQNRTVDVMASTTLTLLAMDLFVRLSPCPLSR